MITFCFFFLFAKILSVSSFGLLRVPPFRVHGVAAGDRLPGCLHSSHSSGDINDGNPIIDRQSDDKYGRGISHISADLNEGDIIAYQDGTWYVDGSEVGDGSSAIVRYMQVDTIQLVWTHNCEHGVINGFDVMIASDDGPVTIEESGAILEDGSYFVITEDYIQCGPEQILARLQSKSLNRSWMDTEREMYVSRTEFLPDEEMLIN